MYLRNGIRLRHLFRDSLYFCAIAAVWSSIVLYLHDFVGWKFLAMPDQPIAMIGIAVSIYLGFKTTSAYNRWWEARIIWGSIVNASRDWAVRAWSMPGEREGPVPIETKRALILTHLAWLEALAGQLRQSSRFKPSKVTRMFGHRLFDVTPRPETGPPDFGRYLEAGDREAVSRCSNPAFRILEMQGARVGRLLEEGRIDCMVYTLLMETQTRFHDAQGMSERIKNTPFPRQISWFGRVFTLILIVLLPLAFADDFEDAVIGTTVQPTGLYAYMFAMVIFTVLISYIFYVMEKISESTEDPFEGGAFDVPISAIARTIEIDLLELLGDKPVPEPTQPVDGVLY